VVETILAFRLNYSKTLTSGIISLKKHLKETSGKRCLWWNI